MISRFNRFLATATMIGGTSFMMGGAGCEQFMNAFDTGFQVGQRLVGSDWSGGWESDWDGGYSDPYSAYDDDFWFPF